MGEKKEYNALVNCYHCKKEHLTNYHAPPPEGWFSVRYSNDTHGLYCCLACFVFHSENIIIDGESSL